MVCILILRPSVRPGTSALGTGSGPSSVPMEQSSTRSSSPVTGGSTSTVRQLLTSSVSIKDSMKNLKKAVKVFQEQLVVMVVLPLQKILILCFLLLELKKKRKIMKKNTLQRNYQDMKNQKSLKPHMGDPHKLQEEAEEMEEKEILEEA